MTRPWEPVIDAWSAAEEHLTRSFKRAKRRGVARRLGGKGLRNDPPHTGSRLLSSMRAVVADPGSPSGMRLAEIAQPTAAPDRVVVEVRHAAINRGDLNNAASGRLPPGAVLGPDIAALVSAESSQRRWLSLGDEGGRPRTRRLRRAWWRRERRDDFWARARS